MNLAFQIPNKLYYIQNFLDYKAYKKLHHDVFKSKLIKLTSTEKKWDASLKHGHKSFVDKTETGLKINNQLQKIKILIENNPFHRVKMKKFMFLIHSMNDGSGINWHNDGGYEYGITYYVNRRWNMKYGGELLFKSEYSNGFIPVVGNSLVIIKAPLFHKVSTIMKSIVPRKTIQIFVDK